MHEVLAEVPRVRHGGAPGSVTPTSQIVGTQAVFNVLMGRYKVITAEFADLMLGYYGATPADKSQEVTQQAAASSTRRPITMRPADLLRPEWDDLRSAALALPGCNGSDEDVLTHAMFPQVAPKFFASRKDGPRNLGKPKAPASPAPVSPAPAAAPHGTAASDVAVRTAGVPIGATVNYVVSLNGATHNVSVTAVES